MNEFCFQFCLLTEHSTPRDLEHFGNPKNEKLLISSSAPRDLEHFGNPKNEKLLKNQTYNEWSVV